MDERISPPLANKLDKLIRLQGALPETVCKRFGLSASTVEAFAEVFAVKGKRGRGRMESQLDHELFLLKIEDRLKHFRGVRPYSTFG